jgi:hypothetical protein
MRTIACGVAAALVLLGCHSIKEELPTEPTQTPTASPVLTVAIPKLTLATPTPSPTPKASPTPSPTPSAEPTPTPTPTPNTGKCGNPLPPAVTRMNVKIHLKSPSRYTLDSTPLVGPDAAYCKKIGFTDGRTYCPVRTEGSADRVACETYAIGKAMDTGRAGPTWYRNGKLCTGNSTDCENHPDNQYLLWAFGDGRYEACTEDDVCGGVDVDR